MPSFGNRMRKFSASLEANLSYLLEEDAVCSCCDGCLMEAADVVACTAKPIGQVPLT